MSVGENIKARRIAQGMTQQNLADSVSLGRSMIAQIERGSKIPNLLLSAALAEVLDCSLYDFLDEKDKEETMDK